MESSNFHHLHQQLASSSSSLDRQTVPSSFYGTTSRNNSAWNPNLILNIDTTGGNYNLNTSSRDDDIDQQILVPPSVNMTSMFQDLGNNFQCNTISTNSFTNTESAAHQLHLAKIKKELSISDHFNDEKLLLKSFSSGDLYSSNTTVSQKYDSFGGDHHVHPSAGTCRGVINNYSQQIFPSTNISNLNDPRSSSSSTSFSTSLGMNFQALDLLSSGSFGHHYSSQNNNNNIGLSFDDLHHLNQGSSTTSLCPLSNNVHNKMSSLFMNGGNTCTETKRSNNALDQSSSSSSSSSYSKATQHPAAVVPKKPRIESRSSSFPPFKVRKEKLGDRIANLQQLVAPFGKTDTASVLMEAIGYIKFLQDQVETLSVPYMKSVRNHTRITVQRGCTREENLEELGDKEGSKQRDLRSRGLCLVPLSFTSYISGVDNVNIGAVWPVVPLPSFGPGGT